MHNIYVVYIILARYAQLRAELYRPAQYCYCAHNNIYLQEYGHAGFPNADTKILTTVMRNMPTIT